MLSIHLRLGLPSGLFPSGFPTNKFLKYRTCKSQTNSVLQFYFNGKQLENKCYIIVGPTSKGALFVHVALTLPESE
jgi:hypothetical protein